MEKISSIVVWYQQKIGAYDKQLWEKSVEKTVIKNIEHVPRKPCNVKTDLIDVDLVRGSTFPKAKPKHGLWLIYFRGIIRLVFLPVYIRWWRQQTSALFGGLLLILYVLQAATLVIYYSDTGVNVSAETLSLAHLLVPIILMVILGLIHAQMVATVSYHKHRRPQSPERDRQTRAVKKKSKNTSKRRTYQRDTDVNGHADTEDTTITTKRKKKRRKSSNLVEDTSSAVHKRNRFKNDNTLKSTETSSGLTEEDNTLLTNIIDNKVKVKLPEKNRLKFKSVNKKFSDESYDDFSCGSSLNSSAGLMVGAGLIPGTDAVIRNSKNKNNPLPVDFVTVTDQYAVARGATNHVVPDDVNQLHESHIWNNNDNTPGMTLNIKHDRNGRACQKNYELNDIDVRNVSDEDLSAPLPPSEGEIILPSTANNYTISQHFNIANSGSNKIKTSSLNNDPIMTCGCDNTGSGTCDQNASKTLLECQKSFRNIKSEDMDMQKLHSKTLGNLHNTQEKDAEHKATEASNIECQHYCGHNNYSKEFNTARNEQSSEFEPAVGGLETIVESLVSLGDVDEIDSVYVSKKGAMNEGGMTREKNEMKCVVGQVHATHKNKTDTSDTYDKALRKNNFTLNLTKDHVPKRKSNIMNIGEFKAKTISPGDDKDISSGQEETYHGTHTGRHVQLLAVQKNNRRESNSSCESEGETTPNALLTPKGQTSETEWVGDMSTCSSSTPVSSDSEAVESGASKDIQDDAFGWSDNLHHANSVMNNLASSTDKVSCIIWEAEDVKKVDLTVLDLGWTIIQKADKIPEKSDYLILGLTFSIFMMFLPLLFRYHHLKDQLETSTCDNITGWVEASQMLFGKNWRERVIVINGVFQRFCISTVFFFLLSVAEKTFKQRLLYAKHFCYLTSSRRAKKYDMPHFRLNKVRNIKTWLSLRSYLKKRGPQRSVDTIVSSAFILAVIFVSLMCVELLHDSGGFLDHLGNWELMCWCLALGIYLLRFMTLGTDINKKYRNFSVLITEQINLYLHMEQKPHKKEELMLANNVLKLAEALLKELENPFRISGLSVNPFLYNITKVVILSAFSAVLTELLGFKLKLYKIKLKA